MLRHVFEHSSHIHTHTRTLILHPVKRLNRATATTFPLACYFPATARIAVFRETKLSLLVYLLTHMTYEPRPPAPLTVTAGKLLSGSTHDTSTTNNSANAYCNFFVYIKRIYNINMTSVCFCVCKETPCLL